MAGRTRSPGALATDAVLPPHLILRIRHRLRRSRSTFGGASKSHWACTACRGLPALPERNDVVRLRVGGVTPCAPLVLKENRVRHSALRSGRRRPPGGQTFLDQIALNLPVFER